MIDRAALQAAFASYGAKGGTKMRRTKVPRLVALVAATAALLLSTWGTGVSLAQDAEPEPTTTTTVADPDDPYEECTWLDRLLDVCLDDGTRCTGDRLFVEMFMSALAAFPVETPCMDLESPWLGLVLLFGGFDASETST